MSKNKEANSDYFGYNSFVTKQGDRIRRLRRTQLSLQKLSRSQSRKNSSDHNFSVRNQRSPTQVYERAKGSNLLGSRNTQNIVKDLNSTRTRSIGVGRQNSRVQSKQNIKEGVQVFKSKKKSGLDALSKVKDKIVTQKNKLERVQIKTDKPQLLINKPSVLNKSGQSQFCYLKQKYDNFTKENNTKPTGKLRRITQQYSADQRGIGNQYVDFDLVDRIVSKNLFCKENKADDAEIDDLIMNRKIGVSRLSQDKQTIENNYLLMNPSDIAPRIVLKKKEKKRQQLELQKSKLQKSKASKLSISRANFISLAEQSYMNSQNKNESKIKIEEPKSEMQSQIHVSERGQKQYNSPQLSRQSQEPQQALLNSSNSGSNVFEQKKQEIVQKLSPRKCKASIINRVNSRQSRSKISQSRIKNSLKDKKSTIRPGNINLPLDSCAQYNFRASQFENKSSYLKKQKGQLPTFDKIQSYQLIISFISEFIEETKDFYRQQISDNTTKLMFLLHRKAYYEKSRFLKALKGAGKNCFSLSGISINDLQLAQQIKKPQVKEKIKDIQSQMKQIFKQFQALFKNVKSNFPNDPYIKLETAKDNFSNQIVLKIFLQLSQLYPKLECSKNQQSDILATEDRIIELIELIFLMSQFQGKKIKPFEFASEIEDFESYYEKYYDKIVKTVDFFQNQF